MIKAQDLQGLFIILYDNNSDAYNSAFVSAGYNVPPSAIEAKKFVVKKMYDMYMTDPERLRSIIGNIRWNPEANNYTTREDVRERVMGYLSFVLGNNTSDKINLNWDNVQGWLFGNQSTIVTQVNSTPASNLGVVIGLVFLGIAVVVLVIFVSR